jgi:hypothetical protein
MYINAKMIPVENIPGILCVAGNKIEWYRG